MATIADSWDKNRIKDAKRCKYFEIYRTLPKLGKSLVVAGTHLALGLASGMRMSCAHAQPLLPFLMKLRLLSSLDIQ